MAVQNGTEFEGQVTVASRIVDILSSGLYHAPSACLKELINNSYDADAKNVRVYVKPDADRIVIEDDGIGFSKDEFQSHFDRVSESHKRDSGETTHGGRKKIGKIGIGFIASNELCETLEIYTTKKGSCDLLCIVMNFDEMKKPIEQRRSKGGSVVKADYTGRIEKAEKDDQYTQLHLLRVRGEARKILTSARSAADPEKEGLTLYGLLSSDVRDALADPKLKTWQQFDLYSKTMLEIALNIPVQYHENWLIKKPGKQIQKFEKWCETRRFSVFYDNTELRKPIVFRPPTDRVLVEEFDFKGNEVSASGYFYVQHGTITPRELQGLLIRIRGAAVGDYDPSFLGFSATEASLLQRWVSCEVWADDALEDAMNIDRRTLREVHPAYVELRDVIHKRLREVLKVARLKIYEASSNEKKDTRTKNAEASLKKAIVEHVAQISPSTEKTVTKMWDNVRKDENAIMRAMKSRSIPEIYQIVVEVAEETLSASDARKFILKLTEKLID